MRNLVLLGLALCLGTTHCDLVSPACDRYEGYDGQVDYRTFACEQVIPGMTESGSLSVVQPPVSEPSDRAQAQREAFSGSFAPMLQGGALLRAEPEWNENPCFEDSHFAHLDSTGTAKFVGAYLEFAGASFGEAVQCCQCWGRTCACGEGDNQGPALSEAVDEICPGLTGSERCMFCLSREYPGRRCGLALDWLQL